MKYEKPVVNKIVFSNEDILAASPHKCPGWPGSNGCDNNGEICFGAVQLIWGGCTSGTFGSGCDLSIGANSADPTETM